MKCAFGKISLKGTFKEQWEYGTGLYGRFLYLQSGSEQALICAFDLAGTFHTEARRFTARVSKLTGIPQKSIWFHELQIHAAPGGKELCGEPMDMIISRSAEEVRAMLSRAEECECSACDIHMGTEFTMNREQYVEGLGGVTVWRGLEFDKDGVPYTNDPSVMLLRGYEPKLHSLDSPVYFDNAVDEKAYLFAFKNKSGKTLGTLSRFAAHPDVAVLFEHSENPDRLKEYRYDFDWPGYLTGILEREFGGTGMYINGPCADLAVKKDCVNKGTYVSSAAECRRIAALIGKKMINEFRGRSRPVDTKAVFKTETFEIKLPVKEDFPRSRAEARDYEGRVKSAQAALDKALEEGRPAYEIKKLIDERWRKGHFYSMVFSSGGYTDEELASREVPVQVTALRFGGYLFVGVPGESLVDITLWLRGSFTGEKTVPVDQVNGYYDYLATPRSLTLGGYTYWSSFVSRGAIPKLKRELYPLLRSFMK